MAEGLIWEGETEISFGLGSEEGHTQAGMLQDGEME
jgi:hypothetical protein